MKMNYYNSTSFFLILFLSFIIFTLPASAVAVGPGLGAASPYGILGATTTVTESTHILGSLGSGGASGTATVTGSTDVANAAYNSAFTDFLSAMSNADSQDAEILPVNNLGGRTLTPGVYEFNNAVSIGSSMILDGNGIYIFQIGGALTTAASTKIQLLGGAQACNIYWVVDVATIGANSTFEGTLMSKSAITLGANSTTHGRMLAQTAVTANAANTRINVPQACTAPDSEPEPTPVPEPEPTEPEPGTEPEPTPGTEPTPTPVTEPTPTPTPEQPTLPGTKDDSSSVNVKINSNGSMTIRAVLPNDAKETGTWIFNIGGKTYEVKGSEDITYTADNVPVGTYKVSVQFIADDNGEVIDLGSFTVSVPTVTGGQLPDTSTPWYNILLVGTVLSMIGLAILIRRKFYA